MAEHSFQKFPAGGQCERIGYSTCRPHAGGVPIRSCDGVSQNGPDLVGKPNEFTIGRATDQHIATLNATPQFIPLKRLLAVQTGSPEYNEESKQGMFYAESWAMVHYLMLGAEGKRRNQFAQLLTSL